MTRIYEGYFNNIDNEVDTDDVQMSSSSGPVDDEHLCKFIISTMLCLPETDDEQEKKQSFKLCMRATLNVMNRLFNIFEISPIIEDYRLFVLDDNNNAIVQNYNDFKSYVDNLINTQIEGSIQFKKDNPKVFYSDNYHYQFPKFAIGFNIDDSFNYKKSYDNFSALIQRCINTVHQFNSGTTIDIDDNNVYSFANQSVSFKEIFNKLFNKNEEHTEDVSTPLKLQYKEPQRISATLIKKAKPYKTYLCIDKNNKFTIVSKLNKNKIGHILGICIDTGVNDEGKMTATFCAMKYGSIERPDTGTVGYRHILFCKQWYDDVEDIKIDRIDGVLNTKELYAFANKVAQDTNSYDSNWNKHSLNNVKLDGYFPVLNSVYRFHTYGTEQGNWYLGSPEENSKLYGLSIKKNSDKLWDDLYYFGIKNTFSMTNTFELASSTLFKSESGVHLLYTIATEYRNDEVVIDNKLVQNYYIVLPLLRLTER